MKLINTAHKKTNQFPQHPTENNLAYHLNALPILDLYLITLLWQGGGYARKDCPLFEDGREKKLQQDTTLQLSEPPIQNGVVKADVGSTVAQPACSFHTPGRGKGARW